MELNETVFLPDNYQQQQNRLDKNIIWKISVYFLSMKKPDKIFRIIRIFFK